MHLACQAQKRGFFGASRLTLRNWCARSFVRSRTFCADRLRPRIQASRYGWSVFLDRKPCFLFSVRMQSQRSMLIAFAAFLVACSPIHVRAAEDKDLDRAREVLEK